MLKTAINIFSLYLIDLLLEVSLTDACYNTPRDKWIAHFSAITDTCFIYYHDPNCNSNWSRKYMPGKTSHNECA